MKALSSVLLLCVTLFGISAHAVQADCPLKNLRKSILISDQSTNPYAQIIAQRGGDANAAAAAVSAGN